MIKSPGYWEDTMVLQRAVGKTLLGPLGTQLHPSLGNSFCPTHNAAPVCEALRYTVSPHPLTCLIQRLLGKNIDPSMQKVGLEQRKVEDRAWLIHGIMSCPFVGLGSP